MGAHKSPGEVIDEVQVHLGAARLIREEIRRLEIAAKQLDHDARVLAVDTLGIERSDMIVEVAEKTMDVPANRPRVERLVASIMSSGAVPKSAFGGVVAAAEPTGSVPAPQPAIVAQPIAAASAPASPAAQASSLTPNPDQPSVVEPAAIITPEPDSDEAQVEFDDSGKKKRRKPVQKPDVVLYGVTVAGRVSARANQMVEEAIRSAREGGAIDRYDNAGYWGQTLVLRDVYRAAFAAEQAKLSGGPPPPAAEPVAPKPRPSGIDRPVPEARISSLPLVDNATEQGATHSGAEIEVAPITDMEDATDGVEDLEPESDAVYGDVDDHDEAVAQDDNSELPDFLIGNAPVFVGRPEDNEPELEERWDEPFASGVAPSELAMREFEQSQSRAETGAVHAIEPEKKPLPRPSRMPARPGVVRHGGGLNTEISDHTQALLDQAKRA